MATSCGRPAPTPRQRVALPYPPYGTLNFFDQAATQVLDGIKSHRGTAILPQRTGPVIDVLYSAAGNSADEAYYAHGIIGYDFEIGDVHYHTGPGTGASDLRPGSAAAVRRHTTNACLDNEGKHEGDGVRVGQLRPAALRAALLQRHRGPGRHADSRRAPTAG